jgi:hypothetical protein
MDGATVGLELGEMCKGIMPAEEEGEGVDGSSLQLISREAQFIAGWILLIGRSNKKWGTCWCDSWWCDG